MTQIDTKFFTEEQIEEKKDELRDLASSIELWSGTNMSEEKEATIQSLYKDLSKKMYAIDCAFLEVKLNAYREIYKVMKEE